MIVTNRVDKVNNFLHQGVWKLLNFRDRGFSNGHHYHLHPNCTFVCRNQAYASSLADEDRANYMLLVIPGRSPLIMTAITPA